MCLIFDSALLFHHRCGTGAGTQLPHRGSAPYLCARLHGGPKQSFLHESVTEIEAGGRVGRRRRQETMHQLNRPQEDVKPWVIVAASPAQQFIHVQRPQFAHAPWRHRLAAHAVFEFARLFNVLPSVRARRSKRRFVKAKGSRYSMPDRVDGVGAGRFAACDPSTWASCARNRSTSSSRGASQPENQCFAV
jgi:hypothetical protein